MKKHITAKEIQSQISKKRGEIDALKLEIGQKQKELSLKEKQLEELNNRLNKMFVGSTQLQATEHSMLRFLERVKGLDLREVEKEMLSDPKLIEAINTLGGNGTFPYKNQFQFVIRNNSIITVKDPSEKNKN